MINCELKCDYPGCDEKAYVANLSYATQVGWTYITGKHSNHCFCPSCSKAIEAARENFLNEKKVNRRKK
jgi:hypothetical protein